MTLGEFTDLFYPRSETWTYARMLRKYHELEASTIQLTGHTFEELRDLFAKGYTLVPPAYSVKLSDLV